MSVPGAGLSTDIEAYRMTSLYEAAVDYLNAGLSIIALTGKQPNASLHPHGLNDAISGTVEDDADRVALTAVFNHPATTGVGIVIPSGLVVADVDTDAAAKTLLDLVDDEGVNTAVTLTRNGTHIWFITGVETRSIWLNDQKLLIRGVGGYVVAPPSVHPDGGVYEWGAPLVRNGRLVADFLPYGVRLAISGAQEGRRPDGTPFKVKVLTFTEGRWATKLVDPEPDLPRLVKMVLDAPDGTLNDTLNRAAFFACRDGVVFEDAIEGLVKAAVSKGHPRAGAVATVKSGYKAPRV